MSICPIWNFTLYVAKSSFFLKSPIYSIFLQLHNRNKEENIEVNYCKI